VQFEFDNPARQPMLLKPNFPAILQEHGGRQVCRRHPAEEVVSRLSTRSAGRKVIFNEQSVSETRRSAPAEGHPGNARAIVKALLSPKARRTQK